MTVILLVLLTPRQGFHEDLRRQLGPEFTLKITTQVHFLGPLPSPLADQNFGLFTAAFDLICSCLPSFCPLEGSMGFGINCVRKLKPHRRKKLGLHGAQILHRFGCFLKVAVNGEPRRPASPIFPTFSSSHESLDMSADLAD